MYIIKFLFPFQRTSVTPLGTLAYILQEKILLLRVENGWQYVIVSYIFVVISCATFNDKLKFKLLYTYIIINT